MTKPSKHQRSTRFSGLLVGLLTIGLTTGCKFSEEDIASWKDVSNGRAKLAGFMKDPTRPDDLRVKAGQALLEMNAFKEIMGVIQEADPRSREFLTESLSAGVIYTLTKDRFDDQSKMSSAGLAYYLFEYIDDVKGPTTTGQRDQELIETVVGWSLEKLKHYEALPEGPRSFREILMGAALARPKFALPMIYAFLRSPPNPKRFLYVNHVLSSINDTAVKQEQARLLLSQAKATYPNLDAELALEMIKNRNETLLRFLLDAVRDARVPPESRNLGFKAAQILKERGLEVLFALLETDDPENGNTARLIALNLIWDFGGTKQLAAALRTLPATGTWFPDGTNFKERVSLFCNSRLAPAASKVQDILVELLNDENWVTRVYAMECIIELYPAEAASLLKPLAKDSTVLEGWIDDDETTIAAVVQSLGKNEP